MLELTEDLRQDNALFCATCDASLLVEIEQDLEEAEQLRLEESGALA